MYGANFAYFDPNIWWNEDEMRKQVEQLNGCFVLTGKVRLCRQRYIEKSNVSVSVYVSDENDALQCSCFNVCMIGLCLLCRTRGAWNQQTAP